MLNENFPGKFGIALSPWQELLPVTSWVFTLNKIIITILIISLFRGVSRNYFEFFLPPQEEFDTAPGAEQTRGGGAERERGRNI